MESEQDNNLLVCNSSLNGSRVSFGDSQDGNQLSDGASGSDVEEANGTDTELLSMDKKPPSFMFQRRASTDEIVADAEVDNIYDQVFKAPAPLTEGKSMDEVQLELSAASSNRKITETEVSPEEKKKKKKKKDSNSFWQRLCCSNIRLQFLLLCVILIATVVVVGTKSSVDDSQLVPPGDNATVAPGDNATVVDATVNATAQEVLTAPPADETTTENPIKISPAGGIELDLDAESTGVDQSPQLPGDPGALVKNAKQMTTLWQHLEDVDTGNPSSLVVHGLRFIGFVAEPVSIDGLKVLLDGDTGDHTGPTASKDEQLISMLNMRGEGVFRGMTVEGAELVLECVEERPICKVFISQGKE